MIYINQPVVQSNTFKVSYVGENDTLEFSKEDLLKYNRDLFNRDINDFDQIIIDYLGEVNQEQIAIKLH